MYFGTYERQGILKLIESSPVAYSSTPDSDRTLRDITVSKVYMDLVNAINRRNPFVPITSASI